MRRWQFILELLFHYSLIVVSLHLWFPLGRSGRLPLWHAAFSLRDLGLLRIGLPSTTSPGNSDLLRSSSDISSSSAWALGLIWSGPGLPDSLAPQVVKWKHFSLTSKVTNSPHKNFQNDQNTPWTLLNNGNTPKPKKLSISFENLKNYWNTYKTSKIIEILIKPPKWLKFPRIFYMSWVQVIRNPISMKIDMHVKLI